jgi:RNA polymerase sigma-70 factor (ECF subfamily)
VGIQLPFLAPLRNKLNGAPGLVGRIGTRPLVAIMLDTDGERIHSVFAVANPDKLGAMT